MNETICANPERKYATSPAAAGSRGGRLAGLIVVFLLALALVVWIKSSVGRRIASLEEAFAAIESESFLLGLHLRQELIQLNGILLRFQLSGASADRESFARSARDLAQRIQNGRRHLLAPEERALISRIESAFQQYQNEAEELLDQSLRGLRRDSVLEVQARIQAKSEPVLDLIGGLIAAQRSGLGSFFLATKGTLASLQSLLWTSVGLLFVLLGLVAALMFRAFIAPLRVQLNESRALAERQERLASLGVLAAGVAHEVRNPLTAIKIRLFNLKSALPAAFADHEDLRTINGELNRLERIVRDFLQFARPSEPELRAVAVDGLLQATRQLLEDELAKRGVRLLVDASPGAVVRADRQQVQQVLINLIQNAAESISDTGTITLRAREGAARLGQSPNPVVILDVIDSGSGIPPGVEKRIFDPLFSTKENGSGLGLSIAARIVEQHGGSIHYASQPRGGTTFSVVLPRVVSDESKNPTD